MDVRAEDAIHAWAAPREAVFEHASASVRGEIWLFFTSFDPILMEFRLKRESETRKMSLFVQNLEAPRHDGRPSLQSDFSEQFFI